MGLGFNVGGESVGAHWSYSGFGRFRQRLASEIGIVLKDMNGFGGLTPWKTIKDPLTKLLHHSDCDGSLSPRACAVIAPRLREIIERWPETETIKVNSEFREQFPAYPEEMVLADYDKQQARLLIAGMERAVEINKPLKFC